MFLLKKKEKIIENTFYSIFYLYKILKRIYNTVYTGKLYWTKVKMRDLTTSYCFPNNCVMKFFASFNDILFSITLKNSL